MRIQEYERPGPGTEALHNEFVPVFFAPGMVRARDFKALLESNNIPVVLESERGADEIYSAFARAIAVLVPESMHDRASDIVAEAERCGAAGLECDEDDELDDGDDFDDDFDDDLDEDLDEEFGEFDDDFDDDDDDDDDFDDED